MSDVVCVCVSVSVCVCVSADLPGVGRRRIYDVVNVFEGLELVSRRGKNEYVWNGFHNLDRTIAKLKVRSITAAICFACSGDCCCCCCCFCFCFSNHCALCLPCVFQALSRTYKEGPAGDSGDGDSDVRKERSLGVLAQRFIMMFIRAQVRPMGQCCGACTLVIACAAAAAAAGD